MAEIRLTVDPSQPLAALRQVGDEMRKLSAVAAELRRASATALSGTGGASGQAAQHEQTTRAIEQQAKATQQLGQTQATQAAIADRVLRSRREEAGLVQRIIDGLGSQDAATRKAAQSTATFLSTLGGASRAASQYAVAMSRIERSLAAGLVTESQANLLREKTAKTFTTANINAKDLRLNMQGLNQSFQVLASVVSRFDPILGATVSTMLRAGVAAGKLSGGFILLGPIAAILGTIAAGFTAVAVAGDRTGAIPTHLARIKTALVEIVARLSDKIDATGTVGWFLTKVEEWAPTTGSKIDDLRIRIAELRAEQEKLQQGGRPLVGPNAGIAGELANAQRDLFILQERERRALILGIDKEAAAQEELRKKINDLIAAKREHTITDEEYLRLLGVLNKQEKQRIESLKENKDAQREANEEARKAAADAKLFGEVIERQVELEIASGIASDERVKQLQLETEQDKIRASVLAQGKEAIERYNIAMAILNEQEKIRQEAAAGATLADQQIDARIAAAAERAKAANALASQQTLVKDTEKIWTNLIDNLQEQWSKLFANILGGGFKTFKDLTSSIKGLFTSLLGNLITGAFAPFFNQLKQGLSGAGGGQGAANIAGGNFEIGKFLSGITSSVSSGFDKAITSLVGLFGGGVQAANFKFTARQGGTLTSLAPPEGGFQSQLTSQNALASLAAAIGGVTVGLQVNNALFSSLDFRLEKTLGKVGELLGGLAGGILGSIFGGPLGAGAGGLLGSVAGGVLFTGVGGLVGSGLAGKTVNETSSLANDFARNFVLSGDPIEALIMSLVVRNKPDLALQLRTLPRASDFPNAADFQQLPEGQRPKGVFLADHTVPVEGPFGFVGAIGSGTGGDFTNQGVIQGFVRSVAAFDAAVASHLTRQEEAIVKASSFLTDKKFSNTANTEKLFKTRAEAILQALGVPLETGRNLFDVPNAQGKKQTSADIVQNLNDFLVARRQIQDLITDLRGLTPPTNNAAKALDDIHQKMNQIRIAAPDLGIALEDFAHLEEEAVAKFKSAFAGSIDDAIAAFIDPFSLAVRELDVAQAQRLREAMTAEADLTKVARLNALERAKLLEQANAPLQQLIDQIQITPSGSSPLAALGTAESRFFTLAGTPGADRGDIAAAAQNFLGLGEQFLGGPTFSAKRDLVLSTLESLLLTLPGVSADTGEQLDGLNLETARGNAANEQLLANLITETSAMRNEIVLLNTKLERALAK